MTRLFFLLAALVVSQTLFGQLNNTLDEYKTVYQDENVTFRQLDSITWLGSF